MRISSEEKHACLTTLILLAVLVLGMTPSSEAIERLRITVGDTTGQAGEQNSAVTVSLTNTMDQIAAFNIWLRLTQPGIAKFQTDLDTVVDTTYWLCTQEIATVCVDSTAVDFPDEDPWDFRHIDTVEAFTGNIDTAGTRISGWELVATRSLIDGLDGQEIKVTAIADQQSVGGTVLPLSPGSGVLFRLLADIEPIPDDQEDRTVGVIVDVSWKQHFSFSDPVGIAIGWVTVEVPDTNYYMCTLPDPGGCLEWTKVHQWECPGGTCDSIGIGVASVAILDETQVSIFNGAITVNSWMCGDVNGDGTLSIGDVSLIIDHLYISQAPLDNVEAGNTNCSPEQPITLTIGDVSVLIDRLFITLTPLCCE